jgi:hypothetical protein
MIIYSANLSVIATVILCIVFTPRMNTAIKPTKSLSAVLFVLVCGFEPIMAGDRQTRGTNNISLLSVAVGSDTVV